MLSDFQDILVNFNYEQIWVDTMKVDPEISTVRNRGGWRGIESANYGSPESWKLCLTGLAATCSAKFSEQINWRLSNLQKFKWMDLIHPAKLDERKKAVIHAQRAFIDETARVYPFAVPDAVTLEHCLEVLYQKQGDFCTVAKDCPGVRCTCHQEKRKTCKNGCSTKPRTYVRKQQ